MGIKDLWNILNPYCEKKPLYELQGKKVAIDLSGWVCEAQNIAEYQVQPRMYLRNLYFRTCYLLLMDVSPVFVLEGRAPRLKYDTIAARNAHQFRGSKPKTDSNKPGKDRSRFNFTLKQCEEMLRLMGLACLTGQGEAEAMCAYLNENKLVDGIISQDSDCFAYGARMVYRNFSVSQQGHHAAKGGSVEIYDLDNIQKRLGQDFGRNKIIALALLCGSDYSDGVFGVGKDSVMKFFGTVRDSEVLERLRCWRRNGAHYGEQEAKISDKDHCTTCGHLGKVQSHTRKGCTICGTSKSCNDNGHKERRLLIKNELSIREKALSDPQFPNEELIREFWDCKETVDGLDVKWNKPDLEKFIAFTVKFLGWEEVYAFKKLFPMVTRWHLMNPKKSGDIIPLKIKKRRNPKGIPSYEIIWQDRDNKYSNCIPKEQLPDELEALWSSIEPENLVVQAYPDLVDVFETGKKVKNKTKKKKNVESVDVLDNLMEGITIESKTKIKKSRKKTVKPLNTLDNFISLEKPVQDLNTTLDLDISCFGDENDLDVSDIVERIVKRKIPVPQIRQEVHESDSPDEEIDLNESSFFINKPYDNDIFEQTFNDQFIIC